MLYRQGLLTVDTADTARMHRLVQDVTLAHLPEADRHQRVVDVVELLAGLFPWQGENPDGWPRSAQLLAHTQAVLAHAHALQLSSPALSQLFSRTGSYLWGRGLDADLTELGELGRARELDEQALAMRQRLYEGDHPDVATSLGNLAVDLGELGEDERARELDEQALAMKERLAKQ